MCKRHKVSHPIYSREWTQEAQVVLQQGSAHLSHAFSESVLLCESVSSPLSGIQPSWLGSLFTKYWFCSQDIHSNVALQLPKWPKKKKNCSIRSQYPLIYVLNWGNQSPIGLGQILGGSFIQRKRENTQEQSAEPALDQMEVQDLQMPLPREPWPQRAP